MSELLKYSNGQQRISLRDREVSRRAKKVYDETRLAGMKVDASLALAGHIMHGVVELDAQRVAMAGNDPILSQLLGEIESIAVAQAKSVQSKALNDWNL